MKIQQQSSEWNAQDFRKSSISDDKNPQILKIQNPPDKNPSIIEFL